MSLVNTLLNYWLIIF